MKGERNEGRDRREGDTVRGEILRVRGGERDSERREGETMRREGRDRGESVGREGERQSERREKIVR